ncbi:unnamed protein product [Pieris brassicae]|uniref:TPX2 C-terminal domain-containing protein n=1 Tax=Pieris brassicae TaxID=7116 RepID=A0A9P0SPE0_PIEBR|nr:unnamed protein product [Pieris brassicae]
MSRNYVSHFRGDFTPNNLRIKDEPLSPNEYFGEHNFDMPFDNEFCSLKKSMSMSDITKLKQDLENLNFENDEYMHQQYQQQLSGGSSNISVSKKTKFVSMAEAIYHYQRDTPTRFHTSKPKQFQNVIRQSKLTLALSPHLRCKERSRPRHIMSQKEKEDLELEEIRKFKLKANPVPHSILSGPHLPEVPRKPPTVPEPFNLTEIYKNNNPTPEEIHTFKARPVPKQILAKPHIPVKLPPKTTKPATPKFISKRAKSTESLNLQHRRILSSKVQTHHDKIDKTARLGPLKPEPFSFLKRDEEIKKRKEEWIKKQIEEEKRLASQFKAQPLPVAVKKRMQVATHGATSSSTSSDNKENFKFEAKPPVVLYKEPFKPVLQSNHSVKLVPFELNTEKRAAEREKFEKQLKEKEEEMELQKQQLEKERKEMEDRNIQEMRAKLVHHPIPIPTYEPFIPKTSGRITIPDTPKFIRRLKEKQS